MGLHDIFTTDVLEKTLSGIDALSTSAEERAQIRLDLVKSTLAAQKGLVDAQAAVVVAEAQGSSWIQRNWRPVTMLTFVAIITYKYVLRDIIRMTGLDMPSLELPEGLWIVIQLGLSGYVVGRSGEKIAETVKGVGGINLFSQAKIEKRTRKALMRELKAARKSGDQPTVDRILDMLNDE